MKQKIKYFFLFSSPFFYPFFRSYGPSFYPRNFRSQPLNLIQIATLWPVKNFPKAADSYLLHLLPLYSLVITADVKVRSEGRPDNLDRHQRR